MALFPSKSRIELFVMGQSLVLRLVVDSVEVARGRVLANRNTVFVVVSLLQREGPVPLFAFAPMPLPLNNRLRGNVFNSSVCSLPLTTYLAT